MQAKKNLKTYERLSRLRDIVLSAAAVLLLWPFFLLISLLIVLDSPGAGPIFCQTRAGLNGKPFTIYKFRSMVPDAEQQLAALLPCNDMDGPAFKIRCDPRITRFGRFLRRSGLDELPQLWNVLRGDMSLVGPRPALLREVANYDERMRQRLTVLPGITCYWQIQPNRNGMPFQQWLALDLCYIRERNLRTDWRIIFKTFSAMGGMNGE